MTWHVDEESALRYVAPGLDAASTSSIESHLLACDRCRATVDEAVDRLIENKRVAITYKRSANAVFSFGRDHGYFGRILSQTVVPIETLAVRGNELVGFCFTPQDGNPLLSTVSATLWYLDPESVETRMDVLRPYLFQEV